LGKTRDASELAFKNGDMNWMTTASPLEVFKSFTEKVLDQKNLNEEFRSMSIEENSSIYYMVPSYQGLFETPKYILISMWFKFLNYCF
jgi:hypothetical protein